MSYIGINPFGQTVRTVTTITATASQTSFTPTGGYTVGYVDVYYNGVKLVGGSDFTASDGLTVVLTTGATANAVVEMITYGTVSMADAVRRSGDTFSGDVTFSTNTAHTGAATFANTVTITGTANVAQGLTSNTLTVTTNTATVGTALYIDSGGRVGIGGTPNTSYSGAKLLALGSAGATILNKSGSNLELTQNGIWNGSSWTYLNTSNAALYQLTGGNHTFYSANSGSAGAGVTWNTVMNIGSGGYSIALQGATPQTGTGITFPATQVASSDANTLDDYEEGSWTPSVGGNATYTTQSGTYTKIGRVVTCEFDVQINSIGTGSTNSLTGLPFTSNSQTNGKAGSLGYFSTLATSIYYLNVRLDASSTTLLFASTNASTTALNTSSSYFQNNTRALGTITYLAA